MTLYYQGARARITHEVFASRSPHVRTFAISELRYIHVVSNELWAIYRQRFVCLYSDPDRLRFAQVVRALKRLLEHRAEHA